MREITLDDEPSASHPTVATVFSDIIRNPFDVIRRWNWKSALFSSMIRAAFSFWIYISRGEGFNDSLGVGAAQVAFRMFLSGISGALIQSFRLVKPAWHGLIAVLLVIPLVSHIIEFSILRAYDYYAGTDSSKEAVLISIAFSFLSAVFNLYAMWRGAMIVGGEGESQSLWQDIKRLPRIIGEFSLILPAILWDIAFKRRMPLVSATLIFTFGAIGDVVTLLVTKGVRVSLAYKVGTGIIIGFLIMTALAGIAKRFRFIK